MTLNVKNRYIWLPLLRLTPPTLRRRDSRGTISVDVNGWPRHQTAKKIAENFNVNRLNVTDDGRAIACSERAREFTFAKKIRHCSTADNDIKLLWSGDWKWLFGTINNCCGTLVNLIGEFWFPVQSTYIIHIIKSLVYFRCPLPGSA